MVGSIGSLVVTDQPRYCGRCPRFLGQGRAPKAMVFEGGHRLSPTRPVRPGEAVEQARREGLKQDVDYSLPQSDSPFGHVMQEGGQQDVLVLAAAPLEDIEDIQRVTLILHHHRPEQALLRWREMGGDNLALGVMHAGCQSAQKPAYEVDGPSQRHWYRSPLARG